MKMLSGKLKEQRFAWASDGPGANPEMVAESTLDASVPAASVAFAHDAVGLHRVLNPDMEEVAVSLHIYSPPFEECQIFPPTGGPPKIAPMVTINSPAPSPEVQPAGSAEPAPSLRDLCASLARIGGELGCDPESGDPVLPDAFGILDLMGSADMSPMEWAMLASPSHFSEFHCVQNLIHLDDHFSVMVACWSPGQSVPPHHLGRGRQEWVKVLHGSLNYQAHTARLFSWEAGCGRGLPEQSTSVIKDCASRMHSIGNASQSNPTVSVHVFSPPLTRFTFHTEKGTERRDVPMLLGVCRRDAEAGLLQDAAAAAGGAAAAAAQLDAVAAPATVRGLMRTAGRRYLSLRALTRLLDEEFSRSDVSDEAITALLRKAVFHTEEWRAPFEGASATSEKPKLVALTRKPNYTLLLRCWGPHSRDISTYEDRQGGRAWTLVLEGELEERSYAAAGEVPPVGALNGSHSAGGTRPRPLRVSTLKEDSVSFVAGPEEQRLCCDADVPCVSLHLVYHPAA